MRTACGSPRNFAGVTHCGLADLPIKSTNLSHRPNMRLTALLSRHASKRILRLIKNAPTYEKLKNVFLWYGLRCEFFYLKHASHATEAEKTNKKRIYESLGTYFKMLNKSDSGLVSKVHARDLLLSRRLHYDVMVQEDKELKPLYKASNPYQDSPGFKESGKQIDQFGSGVEQYESTPKICTVLEKRIIDHYPNRFYIPKVLNHFAFKPSDIALGA